MILTNDNVVDVLHTEEKKSQTSHQASLRFEKKKKERTFLSNHLVILRNDTILDMLHSMEKKS